MNVAASSEWQQSEHLDPMATMAENDFAAFLDLDIDLDFPAFDTNTVSAPGTQQLTDFSNDPNTNSLAAEESSNQQYSSGHGTHPQAPLSSDISMLGNELFDFTINTPYEQPQHQCRVPHDHAFLPRSFVPPTPNSAEMHSDTERYLQQLDSQTRALLEQNFPSRCGDAVSASSPKSVSASDSSLGIFHAVSLTSSCAL